MSSPISFSVLMKSTLRPLPPSIMTLTVATTGSSTSGNFPGLEKCVHWSSLKKEIGTSLHLRKHVMASSMAMISQSVSFWPTWWGSRSHQRRWHWLLGGILASLRLILILLFFALAPDLLRRWGVEHPSEVEVINGCMLAIWVPWAPSTWAPLLHELLELVVCCFRLLSTWGLLIAATRLSGLCFWLEPDESCWPLSLWWLLLRL